jgi:peptidylprolyl isomerase
VTTSIRKKDLMVGNGPPAKAGDEVVVDVETFLPRGEKVSAVSGVVFQIGSRRVIAGLELGVKGMRVGGTREMRVPPHLGYGDRTGLVIPPGAALKLIVTMLDIRTNLSRKDI